LLRQFRHAEVWIAPHILAQVLGKDADRLAGLDHGADDPTARGHAPALLLEPSALKIARLRGVILLVRVGACQKRTGAAGRLEKEERDRLWSRALWHG